jgi:hypothetical protein
MRIILVPQQQLELPLRVPNCVFTVANLCTVRQLLSRLTPYFSHPLLVKSLYAKFEGCFLSGACSQVRRGRSVERVKGWWQYVPDELREEIPVLEADSTHLFSQWSQGTGSFSVSDVVDLRHRYKAAYREAGLIAEQAILQQMCDNFTNPGLCWKILKLIHNPDPTVAINVSTLIQHFQGVFHCRYRALCPGPDPGESWGDAE